MNTAVINIRTDPKTKAQAQKIARNLGFSLSSIINAFLKQFVKTKKVTFSLEEEPSPYLIKMLKKSEKDIKAGRVSPGFKTGEEAVAWLEKQGI